MSHDTQVKQEDVAEAVRIVRYCQRSDLPFAQRQGFVEDALATVRREEREAERLRTLKVIQKLPATAAGADAFRKKLIEELYREAYALEASASEKDGMNAPQA